MEEKKENRKADTPIVSIVLIIKDNFHLLTRTLDSISSQIEDNYELIIVENGFSRHEWHIVKQFSKVAKIDSSYDDKVAYMINRSIAIAKGKYVQVLFPGDVFLTDSGLLHFSSFQENKGSDLIVAPYLYRDGSSPPEVLKRSFIKKYFRKGKSPARFSSTWIKKDVFEKIGLLDLRYEQRAGFDFFCRVYQAGDFRIDYMKKVLLDYEFFKKTPKQIWRYASESMMIIFRHFGFFSTLYWFIFYDHLRMFKWWMRSIKHLYWRQ